MAQREPVKQKRQQRATKPAVRTGRSGAPTVVARPDARVATLEAERDALQAELAAARARIVELEQRRDQVVDRIDWVIDSLHNLLEQRA